MTEAYIYYEYKDYTVLWGGAREQWGHLLLPPEDPNVGVLILEANQDYGPLRINTTMTGRGRLVMIRGQHAERCWGIRVNPYLTGDKGTCTEEHGPKTRRLTDGHTEDNGMRTNKCIRVRTI